MNIQKVEAKGLKIAVIILLFMGILGITVSQIASSAAILIDGVFSIISAVSTLIAIKLFSKTIATLGGKGISEQEQNEFLESLKKIYLYELNINNLRVHKVGKTTYVVIDICINNEILSKTIIKGINKIIKSSVNDKYPVNHTFVNFL